MAPAVIAAIITGACAIAGSFIGQSIASAKTTNSLIAEIKRASDISDTEIKGDIAVIKTEITDLKEEVRKHNGVIERTYKLEQKAAVHEEKINNLEKHIAG